MLFDKYGNLFFFARHQTQYRQRAHRTLKVMSVCNVLVVYYRFTNHRSFLLYDNSVLHFRYILLNTKYVCKNMNAKNVECLPRVFQT